MIWGDTSRGLPWSSIQAGSQTTYAHTRANYATGMDAKRKLQEIAAKDLGGKPEDYEVGGERVFRKGSPAIGTTVGIAGDHLTGAQMAAALGKALGEEVRYNAVPFDVYRGLGFPGAEDLGNMFQFYAEFEDYFCGARDLAVARSLNPQLQDFGTWVARNASRIPTA